MAYERKNGQGTLFTNEKSNDRQPDFKGDIVIDGVIYELAAWSKTSLKGQKYFSVRASTPIRQIPAPASINSWPNSNSLASAVLTGICQQVPVNEEKDLPF